MHCIKKFSQDQIARAPCAHHGVHERDRAEEAGAGEAIRPEAADGDDELHAVRKLPD